MNDVIDIIVILSVSFVLYLVFKALDYPLYKIDSSKQSVFKDFLDEPINLDDEK